MATLAEYRDKVFTRHAVDMLINKARPIRDVLQRFNKKDSALVEEPNERDLAKLMKFIKDNTLQTLSKHLFVASGAKYSIATHIMTCCKVCYKKAPEGKQRERLRNNSSLDKRHTKAPVLVCYLYKAGIWSTHSC